MHRSLFALSLLLPATAGAQTKQLEATLPLAKSAAITRVQSAFADDGLAISSVTGDVVEGTTADRALTVRYRAAVIGVDNTTTRVVLTAIGSRPAIGPAPAAEMQVTSKTGGRGKPVWKRLERIRAALAGDSRSAARE